jgi:hypothetical protein
LEEEQVGTYRITMACYINIEDRYRSSAIKERQMLNSGLYLGLASVAISAGGAIYSGVQADQAGRRQTASARRAQRSFQQGVEGIFEEMKSPGELLAEDMPYLLAAADQASEQLRKQGENFMPGSARQREQISNIIQQRLGGEPLTREQTDFVQRQVAERLGSGYRPAMTGQGAPGGFQVAQGQLARNLGMMAYDVSTQAAGMASDWQKIARAYTVGAFDGPGQYALGAGQIQNQQMALQLSALTGEYNAAQNVGAAQFAQGMGNANAWLQGSQSVASALGGMGTGMATYQQAAEIGKIADQSRYNQLLSQAVPTENFKPASTSMPSMSDRPYQVPKSQFGAGANTASVYALRSPYA